VVYSSATHRLGVGDPASFELSEEALSTTYGLSTFLPAVQLTGMNSRSCSGVVASMELKALEGPISYLLPQVAKRKKPGSPNLNLTHLDAQVMAPFVVGSGQSLKIVPSNAADVIGHGYPPSPCLPAVQFFGAIDHTYTTDGEALEPGESFTVEPPIKHSGAADAVILPGARARRFLEATAEITSSDGGTVDVPVLGSKSKPAD